MVTKGTMDQNLEVGLARRAIDIQFLKVDFAENDLFVAAPCRLLSKCVITAKSKDQVEQWRPPGLSGINSLWGEFVLADHGHYFR